MADQAKRIKIKVISVGTAKEVGDKGAKVTQFKGIDQTTQEEIVFECWSSTLLEHITPEAVIEVDVVHTVNETSSGIYTHDKVTQVYVDGKPVKTKSNWGGRGGDNDSPEKRASIEGQNALTNTCNLIIAGKLIGDDLFFKLLSQKTMDYLSEKLNGKVEPRQTTTPATQTASPTTPASPTPTTTPDRITKDQVSSLRRLEKEQGLDLQQLVKAKGWPVKKLGELTVDQAQVLIDELTAITF